MTQPVVLTIVDNEYVSPFGTVGSGRNLDPVVLVGYRVVVMCARRRQPICGFAQRYLPHGVGWIDSDGMMTLCNKSRRVVYELFPAVWWDGGGRMSCAPIYLAVKRSDTKM